MAPTAPLVRLVCAGALVASSLAACVGDEPAAGPPRDDGGSADGAPGASEAGADGGSGSDGGGGDGAASGDGPSCGAPGTPCCAAGACTGGAQCGGGGICACSAAQQACGGTCVDPQSSGVNCGTCGHDCLGGLCIAGKCQSVTLSNTEASVNGLAVDATGVVWTIGGAGGAVRRSAKDGTNKITLQSAGAAFGPSSSGTDVFWANANGIWRCTLPSCGTGATSIAIAQSSPASTAFDPGEGRVYWANGGGYGPPTGSIASLKLGSAIVETTVPAPLPSPGSILVANGFVYWSSYGSFTDGTNYDNNGRVSRAPLGVGKSEEVLVPFDATKTEEATALGVAGTTLFWGRDNATPLYSKTGGGAAVVFDDPGGGASARAIATDATNVYWVAGPPSGSDGKILSCPISGCPVAGPVVLAQGLASPTAVAVDDKAVYWTVYSAGLVQKIAK